MCCFLISSALRAGCHIPADMSGFWSWQCVFYMTGAVYTLPIHPDIVFFTQNAFTLPYYHCFKWFEWFVMFLNTCFASCINIKMKAALMKVWEKVGLVLEKRGRRVLILQRSGGFACSVEGPRIAPCSGMRPSLSQPVPLQGSIRFCVNISPASPGSIRMMQSSVISWLVPHTPPTTRRLTLWPNGMLFWCRGER